MKFWIFLLIMTQLFAEQYPIFLDAEIQTLQKINQNRIQDYQFFMRSCKSSSKIKKLHKVNLYLNNLLGQYDDVIQKQEDKWSTPKEFLTVGYGDCEDYAIIKYYSLIKLGFDEKKLFITVVKEKFHNSSHMVLSYFRYKGIPPLILDNLSFKVLNISERTDLKAQVFINTRGVYKMTQNFTLLKIATHSSQFETLQKKIKNNK